MILQKLTALNNPRKCFYNGMLQMGVISNLTIIGNCTTIQLKINTATL